MDVGGGKEFKRRSPSPLHLSDDFSISTSGNSDKQTQHISKICHVALFKVFRCFEMSCINLQETKKYEHTHYESELTTINSLTLSKKEKNNCGLTSCHVLLVEAALKPSESTLLKA